MAEFRRLDPETILRRMQEEEESGKESGGILKIYLGYSAGVGKTYRMLQNASGLRKAGIDVAIGVVETHGRAETEALLEGLEILPRKKIAYQGIDLTEMDIDGILARRPGLVLVDELAHTNVPGSRNLKRWQDVEELLKAGINVATALNVQHLESVNDVVEKMTGVSVREVVPDRLAEEADEIELVDVPIEELERRLKEGKVYIPEKARVAMAEFFKKSNLMGLRELALRFTARQVSEEMLTYMSENAIHNPLPVGSRIMIAVGPSPSSKNLVRTAHRMAADLDAVWFAVHVESPRIGRMGTEERRRLSENLKLAEDLGAKAVTLVGDRVSDELVRFARENGVTLVLLGFSSRSPLENLFGGSIGNEIIRNIKPIQVMFVDTGETPLSHERKKTRRVGWDVLRTAASVAFICAVTAICYMFRTNLGFNNISMIMLLPVVAIGINWGFRLGLLSSLLAVASLDFFFVEPYFNFDVNDVRYLPLFLSFFVVGLMSSFLSDRVRWRIEKYREEERFLRSINLFSRELLKLANLKEILEQSAAGVAGFFDTDVTVLVPNKQDEVQLSAVSSEFGGLTDNERGIAQWVYRNGKTAGLGTETLSSSVWYFMPLSSSGAAIGVLALRRKKEAFAFTGDELRVLDSFANIISMAISRAQTLSRSMAFLIDSL